MAKNQGGRRCFSRREITALVGGPGNMAVYRHILVIPPTAKVLPPKNRLPPKQYRRIALPPKKSRHILVYRFRQKSTANSRYCQKVPPTLNTAKRVPPTLDTAQKVPPTLDTAQKVPPTLDIAQKIPSTLDNAEKVPCTLDTAKSTGFSFRVRSLFFVLSGSSASFSVEPLCGSEDRETPRHLPIHLPTPRSAWFSRTMSGFRGESQCCS